MYARLTTPSARELFVIVAFRYQNRLIVHSERTQTVLGFVMRLTRMVLDQGHFLLLWRCLVQN